MSQERLNVNDLIQILIPAGSIYSGHYKSRIEDMGEDTLALALPFKEGQLIPLHVGEQLIFYKVSENGVWVYQTVIQSRRSTPLPVIIVKKPIRADKVQRRNFYRFPITVATQYCKQEKDVDPKDWTWYKGVIRNFSGGGVCLTVKEQLHVGDKIMVDLPLGKDQLRVGGQVKRSHVEGTGKDVAYVLGVEFLNISRGEQERVIQFIFARQRELRSQGIQ
ncbi:type iv pilus assembly protein pilz [Heliomicrobium modesticaldum Ice1]|uniref:Type iv pilus assembly protein pilz n=1 Tax=Heliobacterium modesticaldum (strain ATCC 51547 / Ice1) TaxID=498761 RepID=B0TBX8_HELMI|nr:flagellar brake domain-containing protein [Heliomicrobium modesticaldum]ABZ85251.1 type iv pilus assembly protein pilz [Heliomicrobium modesticaldum Ice1]